MIKEITHEQALEWVSKQDVEDTWHKDFNEWKKHLLLAAKYWPWVKKFYRGYLIVIKTILSYIVIYILFLKVNYLFFII